MNACIIIPARWGSTRFPGKALAKIDGKTLIQRVWELAKKVKNAQEVWIATDDERIQKHCGEFGAKVVMTNADCKNGTERVLDAIRRLKFDAKTYINFQGDAVLTPPYIVEAVIEKMLGDPNAQIATAAFKLSVPQLEHLKKAKANSKTSGTTVTFDKKGRALYFSRNIIPSLEGNPNATVYEHIGLYAYTREALEDFMSKPASALEEAEALEQLRALENGIAIDVVLVDLKGKTLWAVDTPADVTITEDIIRREGEIG